MSPRTRPSAGGRVTIEAAQRREEISEIPFGSEGLLALTVALSKLVKVYDPQFPGL